MNDQPRAFLPTEALTGERIRQVLAPAFDGWSSIWFPAARADVSIGGAGRLSVADEPADAAGQRSLLRLSGPGKRRLLETALGEGLAAKALTVPDRQLLNAFAARLASDFIERVDYTLGDEGGPSMHLELMLDGRAIASLVVGREAIVTLVRRALGNGAVQGHFPVSRTGAVANLAVGLEAILGRSLLTLEDTKGLAVGDVIILDRKLDEGAVIRMNEGRKGVATGHLVQDPSGNSIVIDQLGKGFS